MKKCSLNIPPFKFDPRSGYIKNADNVKIMSLSCFHHLKYTKNLPLNQCIQETNILGNIVEHMLNRQVHEDSLFPEKLLD